MDTCNLSLVDTSNPQKMMQYIAIKLAPIVHMHPNEQFFPQSLETYVKSAALYKNDTRVLSAGSVSLEVLDRFTDSPEEYNLRLCEDNGPPPYVSPSILAAYQGMHVNNGEVLAPCYYKITQKPNGTLYFITYYFFYAFNGGLGPTARWVDSGGLYNAWGFGLHEGDWEEVTAVVDYQGFGTDMVSLRAINRVKHGDTVWTYCDPSLVKASDLQAILVYSAWHSHSSRPRPGEYSTDSPLGIDYCANGSATWQTGTFLRDAEVQSGMKYVGRWGTNNVYKFWGIDGAYMRVAGPVGPSQKSSWTAAQQLSRYWGVFTVPTVISGQHADTTALTCSGNRLHMAYTGASDSNIYYSYSSDGGASWLVKSLAGASSSLAIAALPKRLVVLCPDTSSLGTLWVNISSDNGDTWLRELLPTNLVGMFRPQIVNLGDVLYLISPRAGLGLSVLHLHSSRDGVTWTDLGSIGQYAHDVALTVFKESLYIAYTNTKSATTYVSHFNPKSDTRWSPRATVPEFKTSVPAIVSHDNHLYLFGSDVESSATWVIRSADGMSWDKAIVIPGVNSSVPSVARVSFPSGKENIALVYADTLRVGLGLKPLFFTRADI